MTELKLLTLIAKYLEEVAVNLGYSHEGVLLNNLHELIEEKKNKEYKEMIDNL